MEVHHTGVQILMVEPILYPRGSEPALKGTSGTCVVCGEHVKGIDCVRRCLRTTPLGNLTGHRICRKCSPYTTDTMLARYGLPYDQWEENWKSHSVDAYGRASVTRRSPDQIMSELETVPDDPD